jgi:capsule polysaccharide export protein KpsE/RkpR
VDSLRQIYGEENVRVRAARARVGDLQRELTKMSGTSTAPTDNDGKGSDEGSLYPPLRQLPRLAVPYADLYRRVRIQETVFELLSQQYEMARIEEAKDTPVVSIIDPPLIAEKKSFPPRLLVILILTSLSVAGASVFILFNDRWSLVDPGDPRKLLAHEMGNSLRAQLRRLPLGRGAR